MPKLSSDTSADRTQERHKRTEEPRTRPALPSWRLFSEDE